MILVYIKWRHNGRNGVSNHQPHHCLLNRLFRRRSKKTSKFHVTGLCAGNSPVTGGFPAQKASNAEKISIWWRHHDIYLSVGIPPCSHGLRPGISYWTVHACSYIIAVRVRPRSKGIRPCPPRQKPTSESWHLVEMCMVKCHQSIRRDLIVHFEWRHLANKGDTLESRKHIKLEHPLRWRHNELDGVSKHQPHHGLLNRLFRSRSKKASKQHVTGLCEGNSPVTGKFPAQGPSNAEIFPFDDVVMTSHFICLYDVSGWFWAATSACFYSVYCPTSLVG